MGVYLGTEKISAYAGGALGKPEEEKTVTAETSVIEVNPSSGKVMKKVTVNPTPTESKSVTPTTSELTVTPSEGKHLSQVVVGAVEDVIPEVTAQTPVITQILEGLVGKAQGANATADKILEGYSAYVGQELVNGEYDPATADPDLIPENIREGIDIFGVLGTMLEGIPGIDFGEVTLASDKTAVSFSHSLGVVPSWIALVPKSFEAIPSGTTIMSINGMCIHKQTGASIALGAATNNKSESTIKFNTYYSSCPFPAITYYWIAIA